MQFIICRSKNHYKIGFSIIILAICSAAALVLTRPGIASYDHASHSPSPTASAAGLPWALTSELAKPRQEYQQQEAAPTLTAFPTSGGAAPTATAFPTATYTQRVRQPTFTLTPTQRWPGLKRTPTATATFTRTPTLTPTITLTPTPPMAYLRIDRPGEFSKVISPINLEANVTPGEDGKILIDLIGEDSRTIANQILNYSSSVGWRFWINPSIDFNITAVAETARLVLSVQDIFGRKTALSSVDLVLLFLGSNVIRDAPSQLEPYVVWYPVRKQVISGGNVIVGGLAMPLNDNPLIIELIDERGTIVGSTRTTLTQPAGGEHTHSRFEVVIPYIISTQTPVRLTLRQESAGRIPGTIALSSLPITLEP